MLPKSLLQSVYNNSKDLVKEIQYFISDGEDLNSMTKYGESALRVASNNGRFDVIKILLEAGADKDQLKWSNTFYEVAYGNLISIKSSIDRFKDLEYKDFWDRTPWLMSIQVGDIEKSAFLLSLGANKNAVGRCGKQPMAYAIQHNNVEMLKWLFENGFEIESTDDFLCTPLIFAAERGKTDCVEFLINAGADIYKENHIPKRAIEVASNLDIVKLLVDKGDDINDINEKAHALLTRTKINSRPQISKNEYLKNKYRVFGNANPEITNHKFWVEMVRTGASAWYARTTYDDTDSINNNPVWCYERYGRSITILKDGTIIEIAGEHEDYYDPDFCIYNDVTVFHANGEIIIYSYPSEVFPPTDFHSATMIGNYIYIIGSLGYMGQRITGYTPVYRLSIPSMTIEKIETYGKMPGWLSKHKAYLQQDSKIIITGGEIYTCIDGEHEYEKNNFQYCLCTISNTWEKLNNI